MKLETLPLSQPSPSPAARRWRKPAMALFVLALAGGGWSVMQARKAPPAVAAEKKAQKGPDTFELASSDVAAIDARALSVNLPLSGALAPIAQATIKAKISGEVRDTTVREGMAVTAGQVLARLDQADWQARASQQQAALDEAQARLSMANRNHANSAALLKQNFISQTQFDTTANAVELARAAVKAAQAQLDLARIALNDSVIRAPISGIVSRRHVQAGEKVAPDMPVFTIVNLAELTLEAQVPASDIPRVKVGQDVSFKVDGFAQREFTGKVARINPAAEAGARAMLVYVSVANQDGALLGGMFAKGHIVTARSPVMPLVPLAAVRDEQGKQVVYRIDNGNVVAQPVKLGLRNEDQGLAEVTEGLAPGAQVIVARLEGVKPGVKVKTPAMAPAQPQLQPSSDAQQVATVAQRR